jgi:hypothetical protein
MFSQTFRSHFLNGRQVIILIFIYLKFVCIMVGTLHGHCLLNVTLNKEFLCNLAFLRSSWLVKILISGVYQININYADDRHPFIRTPSSVSDTI